MKPAGWKILIKPIVVEQTTKGGIILQDDTIRNDQRAVVIGEVLAVGVDAYKESNNPWVKVGDKVIFAQYSGMTVSDPEDLEKPEEDRRKYVLCNDTDILGTYEENTDE